MAICTLSPTVSKRNNGFLCLNSFKVYLILVLVLLCGKSWGQSTSPASFDFTGGSSFNFTTYSSTSFPTNITVGYQASNSTGNFVTDVPSDATNGSAASNWNGEGANGISFLGASANRRGSFIFRGNTTTRTSITVQWTCRTIVNGANNNYIELQWRNGTSGNWNNVTGVTTSGTYPYLGGATATTYSIVLPSGAENLSDLKIRWIYYEDATGGTRDRLAIDDITISSSPSASITNYYSKSTGDLSSTSSWTDDITLAAGSAPANFTADNQVFNVRNNSTPTIGADWTVSGANSKIIVGDGTNGCNFTIPASYAVSGTVDVAATATLTLQHLTSFPTFGTLNATSAIIFDGNGTQTIPAGTYPNLTIQNSGGTKSLGGNITLGISNTFTLAASTILNAAAYTITFGTSGNANINGTLQTTNTNGFSGAASTTIVSTNSPSITLGTSSTIVYNAASPQAVTSRTYANLQISNTGAAKTPGGNITLGNSNTFTLDAGVTYTSGTTTIAFGTAGTAAINGIFQTAITTASSFSGTTTTGSISNANSPTITLGTGSTIEYNSTSAQTITTTNSAGGGSGSLVYYNLLISGTTGVKTFGTSPTIAAGGTVTVNASCIADMASTQMNFNGTGCSVVINGTLNTQKASGGLSGSASSVFISTNSPTITLGSASTINYNGTGAQVISAIQYANLTIAGTRASTPAITLASGTIGISGAVSNSISGAVTWINTSNTVDYNGTGSQTIAAINYNNLTISGARSSATITLPTGTIDVAGAFSYTATGSPTISPNASNTVNFSSASSQTIPAFTYNSITNTGNGLRTLANGTIKIASTFTPGSGNYTIGTSTVEFNGTSAQTIPIVPVASGANYYNLTYSGSNTGTLGGTITVGNDFTQSAGTFVVTPSSTAYTLNVGGNFTQTVGTFNVTGALATAGATVNVTGTTSINGNFAMEPNSSNTASTVLFQANGDATFGTSASFDWMSSGTSGTIYNITFGIKGNYNWSKTTGQPTTGGSGTAKGFVFNGSGTLLSPQTLTYSGTSSTYYGGIYAVNSGTVVRLLTNAPIGATTAPYNTFTVNGTLDAQNFVISGGSSTANANNTGFTLASGATIITQNATGVAGSITTALKNFSSGANYEFQGAATGTFITTPTANTVNNLTVNKTAGVTLSQALTVNGTLTFTSGILTTTGVNVLTIGNTSSTAISGTSTTAYVSGPMRWTLPANLASGSTYVFPIGKSSTYYPLSLVNPVTGATGPVINAEAFAASTGGSQGSGISSISTTEYWQASVVSGNLTSSSLSLTRQSALSTLNTIAKSSSLGGNYDNIGGTVSGTSIINSNDAGSSLGYFVMGVFQDQTPSPSLRAGSGVTVDAPFTITFTDDSAWRTAISSIKVGGTTLAPGAYDLTAANQITFTPSASTLFQSPGDKAIVIYSTGYLNASVTQTIGAGAANKLAFTTQPGGGTGGTAFATQPIITVQDQYSNTVSSAANSITLAIGTNPSSGILSATLNPITATSGVATYSGVKIDKSGTGYTLTASTDGLTGATSSTFNITVGAAAKLAFTTQPGGGSGGTAFATQPVVTVQDAGGNTVTSAGNSITLAIGTNLGGGTLTATSNPKSASSGVASFTGVKIDKSGTGYTITAAANGLTGATSSSFDITVGAAAKLAFTTQPGGGTGGTAFATQPIVEVQDAGGNTVASATNAITLTITSNPGSVTLSATTNPLSATSGVATFDGVKIDKSGNSYTLTATAAGLTIATSSTFNIAVGSATKLAFTTQPGGGIAGTAFATQPVVTVQDAGGNTVTNATNSIMLDFGNNAGSGVLTATLNPKSAGSGVATFAGVKIDNSATGYTLSASASGLSSAISSSFNITPADPISVSATAISSTQINIAFTANGSNNVVVAWNSSNTFGSPTGIYTAGNSISGSGTVLYVGTSSPYSHTTLAPNTVYYYKVWTVDTNGTYSAGVVANATTANLSATSSNAANPITSSGFTANWDAVVGATGYKLDVSTNSNFGTLSDFVTWTFPTIGTTLTPDASNSNNSSKTITTNGGTISDAAGATTQAPSANAWQSGSGSKYWQVDVNATGFYSLSVSSKQRSSGSGPRDFKLQYKISNGSWSDVTGGTIAITTTDFTTGVLTNVSLPSECENQASLSLRWIMTSNNSEGNGTVASGGTNRIDDIIISGLTPTFVGVYNDYLVSGSSSQSVTGLSPATTYYYRVRATSTNSTSTNSNVTSVTTLASYSIAASTNDVIKGSVTGAASYDAGTTVSLTASPNSGSYRFVNWTESGSFVSRANPYTFSASANRILVANFESFSPTISGTTNATTITDCPTCDVTVASGGLLTIDEAKTYNSVTVAPGGKLTLANGFSLTAPLTLRSSASGTGTYVDLNAGTGLPAITATVEQWLTSGRNWYISMPITTAKVEALSTAVSVVWWNEPSGVWSTVVATSDINPLLGYISVATNNTQAISFSGTLNNGSQTVSLSRTVGATKEGFNLIGNPYPSYLNPRSVINASTKMEKTIWYRTKNTSYNFETVNTTSGEGTNIGNNINGAVTGFVPPMQAFWVRVLPNGNPAQSNSETLTFTNAMRSHESGTNRLKAPAVDDSRLLRLQVSNDTNNDETLLYFNTNASNGLDAYDSRKMSNASTTIPEIYTTVGSDELVINGMNSYSLNTEIPLCFRPGQINNFSLKATEIRNFDSGTRVMVKDSKLAAEVDITDGTAYDFSTTDAVATTNRFSIIFRSAGTTTGTPTGNDAKHIVVTTNALQQIVVVGYIDITNESSVFVYNAVGQKLTQQRINSTRTILDQHYVPGVYIVTVLSKGKTTTRKVTIY